MKVDLVDCVPKPKLTSVPLLTCISVSRLTPLFSFSALDEIAFGVAVYDTFLTA